MSLLTSPFIDVAGNPHPGEDGIVIARDLSDLIALPDASTRAVAFTQPVISDDVVNALRADTRFTIPGGHLFYYDFLFRHLQELEEQFKTRRMPEVLSRYFCTQSALYQNFFPLPQSEGKYIFRLNAGINRFFVPHQDKETSVYVQNLVGPYGTHIVCQGHDLTTRELQEQDSTIGVYHIPGPSALLFNHAGPQKFAHAVPWAESGQIDMQRFSFMLGIRAP